MTTSPQLLNTSRWKEKNEFDSKHVITVSGQK